MPQMSPLLWTNLFITFSIILLMSFIKIYFSNSKSLKMNQIKTMGKQKNDFWMW